MTVRLPKPGRPAVFLDKDGTLIHDIPYNVDPAGIRLTLGASAGLARLSGAGYALVLVSNQSGVARGFFEERALEAVRDRLATLLASSRVHFDSIQYCPHHPEGTVPAFRRNCGCRKPARGMLHRAAGECGLDLTRSWLIGDIIDDIEAGRRAGCRTILIDNGNETEWCLKRQRLPHHLAGDLDAAARLILALDKPSQPRSAMALEERFA